MSNLFSELSRRLDTAVRVKRDFRNWIEIWRHVLVGQPLASLRRRDGLAITGAEDGAIWNHYNDIFYHRTYTLHVGIPERGVVVDVGANVGLFSILAAPFAAEIHAFEPSASNFRLLEKNLADFPNVTIHNSAVGSFNGAALLRVDQGSTEYTLQKFPGELSISSGRSEPVRVTTLAQAFADNRIKRCDLLKLDCEGAEYDILLQAPHDLLAGIGAIVLEFHDHLSGHTHYEVLTCLNQCGFDARVYNEKPPYGMMVAVRSGGPPA
jgi:FkbM family methyltransferase